ncbi:thrombospondin type 3 repeat-containing protein, partial [Pleionea sediminis]|uniref:thrombospondin type 3 repeat-containing protein n=1 Tax=Pleionea sediminis TaxID=2569479 RepID=UPI00197B1A9A
DRDGDGVENDQDAFPNDPNESSDLDGDGIGDNADTDRDGDGVANDQDAFPNDPNESSDLDGDGIGDNADTDRDGDGVANDQDAFPNDPNETSDLDGDGIGDNADTDRDGDGVENGQDAFPNDPNETSDLDGDGIGDNADPDRDGDGVDNGQDAFPDDPNETSDIDGDGIGDNADTDRDGDGVENDQDAYPNDPTRSALEKVNNLQVERQDTSVRLFWTAVPANSIVQSYEIRRADWGGSFAPIGTISAGASEYIDSNVSNDKAYQYELVSISSNGDRSTNNPSVQFFVAYNNNPVSNLSLKQQGTHIDLSWQTTAADEVIILRGEANFPMTQINAVPDNNFTDSNVVVPNSYRYQLVNRKYFTNPIDNSNFHIDGPASDIASIKMLQPMAVSLNATKVSDGNYELSVKTSLASVTVTGSVSNATGPATISASNGSQTETVTTNGAFSLTLPVDAQANQWQINAETSTSLASASLTLLMDSSAPVLSVNGPSQINTDESSLTFTGSVTDDQKVDSVAVTSSIFGGQIFKAIVSNDGSFSVELPIEVGENQLTFVATDASGNSDQKIVTVTKENNLLPKVSITSHNYGQTLTESTVTITGLIETDLPPEQVTIKLGNISGSIKVLSARNYQFQFDNIGLVEGENKLEFKTISPVGESLLPFILNYDEAEPQYEPQLTLNEPLDGSFIRDESFVVKGEVYSPSELTVVTINGQPVDIQRTDSENYYFNYPVSFQADSITVDIDAVASNGLSTTQQATYYRDNSAPQIVVDNNLMASPAVNTINELPYTITGRVIDDNLSSLTLNGRAIQLILGNQNNEFSFTVAVNVENQVDTNIDLRAYDLSGNSTGESFVLRAESAASIDIIAPSGRTEFQSSGSSFNLQVIARVRGTMDTDRVRLAVNNQTPVFVDVNETLVNTSVVMSSDSGEHRLKMEVVNASNDVIYQTARDFSLLNEADIPLELIKTEPFNGQSGIEPNGFIAIYTNKSIDPSLLSFDVRETANGKTYINNDEPGTNFLNARGYQLVDVSRNNEIVPGGISRVPGDNLVAFYPSRAFAYNADVTVKVTYDGNDLTRFAFKVRPLPTFLTGSVFDQLDQPVANVSVELPELQRKVFTDEEGVFSFGFGDAADEALPQGTYRLVVNRGFGNPKFGVTDRLITIESGRRNSLAIIKTPVLDKQVPFNLLNSGQENEFAGGELTLDLTSARVNFADGSASGQVHVSFVEISGIDAAVTPIAYPSWVYSVQPSGIQVSGNMQLEIKMPKLYNSYDYVPNSGTYVTLIGRDSTTHTLRPVGVGVIDGYTVKSVGDLRYERLDFIGYSFVAEDKQRVLERYANGEIGLQALMAMLRTE